MRLSRIYSRATVGINAPEVAVETHLQAGLPRFCVVGLPETAVRESRERVRSAIINSRFHFPQTRITVNLAPADLPKQGGRFDLAIAISVLLASKQIRCDNPAQYEFAGELALSGELRPVDNILSFAIAAAQQGRQLFVARDNAALAARPDNAHILPADHLLAICAHLQQHKTIEPFHPPSTTSEPRTQLDMADIMGQPQAKRALEIAASGGHSLLMSGPPGAGKTSLASRLPGILPPLTKQQALETACIHGIGNHHPIEDSYWLQRPFRAPHHSASSVALVGGGSGPKPGEISLAHHGVLFLDELPEFKAHALESLREPLGSGRITIARAERTLSFPAQFQLIAAMNPCPCGYLGHPERECHCSPNQVARYRRKISGPLLDRIDLHIELGPVPMDWMLSRTPEETSQNVQKRVSACHATQLARQGCLNGLLERDQQRQPLQWGVDAQDTLLQQAKRLQLSARGFDKTLRVARTIADMAGCDTLEKQHIQEALSFRPPASGH